jgi:DNA-directed RNA polymerase specialized sigma24 family protein
MISKYDVDKFVELRARGNSYTQIASIMGMPNRQCAASLARRLRVGSIREARKVDPAALNQRVLMTSPQLAGPDPFEFVRLWCQGESTGRIAQELGMPSKAAVARLAARLREQGVSLPRRKPTLPVQQLNEAIAEYAHDVS